MDYNRDDGMSDRAEGMWKQLKGKIKEEWGKLTDDEIDEAEGKWEKLSGKVQERYGRAKDDVELEIRRFRDQHEPKEAPYPE